VLGAFPVDTINEETVELLQPYLQFDDIDAATPQTNSSYVGDTESLIQWVDLMVHYFDFNKEVLPLKVRCSMFIGARGSLEKVGPHSCWKIS
jgi:dynein heavy chain